MRSNGRKSERENKREKKKKEKKKKTEKKRNKCRLKEKLRKNNKKHANKKKKRLERKLKRKTSPRKAPSIMEILGIWLIKMTLRISESQTWFLLKIKKMMISIFKSMRMILTISPLIRKKRIIWKLKMEDLVNKFKQSSL